jgi:deazaflavin-dependent oxidoreductase (nitroreductase family)
MATVTSVPRFVRLGNFFTTSMLRAGIKLVGPGNRPMYLLTVQGRKSGQPRTTPIVVIEADGQRYLLAPFGAVDWVRNLRAAGMAVLSRGRREEQVRARELPREEAGQALKRSVEGGIPSFLSKYFDVTRESSLEEFERAVELHPMFLLQHAA